MRIVPETILVRKIILVGTLSTESLFLNVFLGLGQQFFKSVLDSPPKSLFKDFPGGRIGEWTEAQPEEKETDFDNSVLYSFV